jgi:hypothetical protein
MGTTVRFIYGASHTLQRLAAPLTDSRSDPSFVQTWMNRDLDSFQLTTTLSKKLQPVLPQFLSPWTYSTVDSPVSMVTLHSGRVEILIVSNTMGTEKLLDIARALGPPIAGAEGGWTLGRMSNEFAPVATGLESPVVLSDVVDRPAGRQAVTELRVTTDNPLALDSTDPSSTAKRLVQSADSVVVYIDTPTYSKAAWQIKPGVYAELFQSGHDLDMLVQLVASVRHADDSEWNALTDAPAGDGCIAVDC